MRNVEKRAKARELRLQGLSLREIADEVGVVRSTVSGWVRDIELEDHQIKAIDERGLARLIAQNHGAKANRDRFRAMREEYQQDGRKRAKENPTPLHIMGCMLYWGEGSKDRKELVFVNSDPGMMILFCRFLREEMRVTDDSIVIHVTSHSNDPEVQKRQERYWLDLLELPDTSLRKTIYKEGNPRVRHRIIEQGICRVAVRKFEILQHIYGAIQEYAGIDKPEWLG
jgi:transposase-like protein